MCLFIQRIFLKHEQGCLTIFPWFIQDDREGHLHAIGIFVLILIIIGIIGGIILFIFVISRFFKTPTGLNNPEFADVPADPTLHTGRNDRVYPEDGPDSRGDRDKVDGRHTERKISFESGPILIPEKEPSTTIVTTEKRRLSRPRERSPPRQVRRTSVIRETSPPRERRISLQRERSPPRQVRRMSVQKERSTSNHALYTSDTQPLTYL